MSVVADPETRSRDELEEQRALVEEIIGRPLRRAEQAIDVLGLDQALKQAKDTLDEAIKAEQARAARRALRTIDTVRLNLTTAMLAPLERLFRLGRREAYAELERAGYEPRRTFAAVSEPEPEYPALHALTDFVRRHLRLLSVRVEDERGRLEFAGEPQSAIARALYSVPGARNIASLAVSSALTAGLTETFEANEDLVPCWEYSAVLDDGTCDECEALDGTEYQSLEELYLVLPDFGPNPACYGGGRCRCRAVPCGSGE